MVNVIIDIAAAMSVISTAIATWLTIRYKQEMASKRELVQLRNKEVDDRQKLTEQILLELRQTKEDLDKAHTEITLLNQKLIEAEHENMRLSVQLEALQQELEQLKNIIRVLDPVSVEGCALFGTPGCPFTRLKQQVDKISTNS